MHRDVKPANLFLTRRADGTPLLKVLDFGVAKMESDTGNTTQPGDILGTPLFMSPEHASVGAHGITPASDRFSLGLVAHRLLVGRHYWLGETITQLVAELVYEPMPPPSDRGSSLGRRYDAWFAKACNRDPTRRFATASGQIEALADAIGSPSAGGISVSGGGLSRDILEVAPTVIAEPSTPGSVPSSDRSAAPEVIHVAHDLVLGRWRGACLCVWRAKPTMASALALAERYQAFASEQPSGFLTLGVIEAGVPNPDGQTSKAISAAMDGVQGSLIGTAVVLEATGFAGAALRAAVTAMTMVTRSRFPRKFFASVPDAAAWSVTLAPDLGPASALVAAFAAFREAVATHPLTGPG